jgi:APA family basic amino acid/polyamine antiporter
VQTPELRRALGLWSAIAIVIGTAIGSGVFLVANDMINGVGTPGMVFVVWIFGGVLTMFGALTYAELSAALPGAGGEYVYLNAAYGPFIGFIYGWTQTLVAKTASIATLASGFIKFTADLLPQLNTVLWTTPWHIGPNGGLLTISSGQLFGIGVILFLGSVNYMGVRAGGRVQIAFTILKLALIAGLIVAGLTSGHGDAANFQTQTPAPGGMAGFFVALVAALWAYDGWNNAGMLGSEIENPQRNLPRALIIGTSCMIAVYLLTNLTYFYILKASEVGAAERVAADMMRRVAGEAGGKAVSIAAMISIFAALNGSILSGSRVPFAMSRAGLFFRVFGSVHPRFRTPGAAIALLALVSSLVLLSGQYKQLYTLVIFPSWILYGMTAASVIVLRIRRPDLERPYRVPGYPLVPVAFVLVAALLLYSTLRESPRESGIGLVLILAGLPFYFYWKARRGDGGAERPDNG